MGVASFLVAVVLLHARKGGDAFDEGVVSEALCGSDINEQRISSPLFKTWFKKELSKQFIVSITLII